ncbi:MAG: metalloregulator ArsR/SmtB family transcription factor [Anaerolineae bacterium]|nr:metalloregulator ArsR/SmtB family transcription factor [Anaerolineae bacterium]
MDKHLLQEINRLHAEICGGLSDAHRIAILYTLAEGAQSVMQIAEALELPQPTISRHLKILRERGMVVAERRGTTILYALSDKRIIRALDLLRQMLNDHLERNAHLARVAIK